MTVPPLHPFTYSDADVVFRSSDNVVYKLHKLVLSLASDFFSGMFELPQPNQPSDASPPTQPTNDEEVDGLPVVPVSEPSSVLTSLFLLCYPIELDPDLASIAQVRAVLEAAMKYDLRKVLKITRSRLLQFTTYAPMRVYAIACKLGFEDDARHAAKEVHKQHAQDKYVEELEEIPFGAYHRLLYYCSLGGGSAPERQFTFSHAATTAENGAMGARQNKKKRPRGARVAPTLSSTSTPSTSAAEPPSATTLPANGSPDSQTYPTHPPPETAAVDDQDVVFAASDGPQIRSAGSAILQASPALRHLADKRSSSTDAIRVPEPAATIRILVRIYDPFEHVEIANLLDVHNALAAAVEYKMQKAVALLQASLKSRPTAAPAAEDSVLLFAIACRFGMRDLALVAARATLRTNVASQLIHGIDEVDVSAGYLHRLLDYHRRCRAAITPIFETRTWLRGFWLPRVQNGFCAPKAVPVPPNFSFGQPTVPRAPAKWVCWYEPYMKAAAVSALWPSSTSVTRKDVLYAGLCVNPAASVAGGTSAVPVPGYCAQCMQGVGAVELFQFSQHVASTITVFENQVRIHPPLYHPILLSSVNMHFIVEVDLTWPTLPVQQTTPPPAASA